MLINEGSEEGSLVKKGMKKIPGQEAVWVKARGGKSLETPGEMKDGRHGGGFEEGESDPR